MRLQAGCDEAALDGDVRGDREKGLESRRAEQGIDLQIIFQRCCGTTQRMKRTSQRSGRDDRRRLKCIQQTAHHSVDAVVMNQRVTPLVVAQSSIDPKWFPIEDEEIVLGGIGEPECAREAELERHVESRRRAYAAQVVDGGSAGPHQVKDSKEPAIAGLPDLENATRCEAEEHKGSDKGDEQPLIRAIEWHVEEYALWIRRVGHLLCSRARRGALPGRPARASCLEENGVSDPAFALRHLQRIEHLCGSRRSLDHDLRPFLPARSLRGHGVTVAAFLPGEGAGDETFALRGTPFAVENPIMTGPELRSRRLRLGMNREQIAHAVGVDANVVAQWEDGAVEIRCPRAVEQILRQNITERQMLSVER